MSWGLGFLKRVTGPERRRAKKSRKRSLTPLGPYFRSLSFEPLEYRRLLTAPAITGLNPAFPVATGSAQSFTINGSNFQTGCTVTLVDGAGTTYANRTISSESSTQIVINPNFGTAQDVWSVEVINPGSSASNQFYFPTTPSSLPQPDALGVDYSSARPTPSSLQAAGSTFAVRYVSSSGNSKNIGLSEAQSLLAGGQQIILVSETTGTEMQNGYNQGVTDANAAVSEATAAGAPSNFFCYFACDFSASSSQYAAIDQYLQGAASVLGGTDARVGIYGSSYVVSQALAGGYASKAWQTVAWSNGNEYSGNTLFQYAGVAFLSGCDVDVGIGSNLGQWTPAGLGASATGIQTVSISWSAAGVATGYTLDRATSSAGPWTQIYSGAAAQYADSGLQFGTTYYYQVCFDNGSGRSSFSSSVSATTLSGVPTGLAATATGSQSISVSWNTVTGATSYTLQRATSASGPWTQIYTGSTASYSNSGLQPGTTYYYEVKSGTTTGSSAYSSSVSKISYPATPTGLTASATGPQSISVSWSTMTGAITYALQRATSSSGPWTQVYSNSSAQYSDSGLQVGVTYYYEVRSGNSSGNSAYSSAMSATTLKTITWSGGGSNTNWSTAANWGGMVPVAGCDLVFAGTAGLNTTNDLAAGTQFGNLTFNAAAGAFILNGNSLNLSGIITNNSSNTQTINLSLGGTNGVTKTGAGMMILSAANSFTGGTVVTGGTMKVTAPAALPDGSNLSVGANVLAGFGAPVVPVAGPSASAPSGATAAAGGASQPSPAAIPAPASASSIRTPSLQESAIRAATVSRLARNAARIGIWAATQNTGDQRDVTTSDLRAWDAALAEYGRV